MSDWFSLLFEQMLRKILAKFVATDRILMETVTFTGVSAYVENWTARVEEIAAINTIWDITKVVIALCEPDTEILRKTDRVAFLPIDE